jgi:hypothetical protein
MMLQLIKYKQIKKILTKKVEVQAFVRHVLIDQHLFILFRCKIPKPSQDTCCSFAESVTSFLNSSNPCVEAFERFFTAISSLFASTPCNIHTHSQYLW